MAEDARSETAVDPSPARQALDEVFAEYERTISEKDKMIAELKARLDGRAG